MTTKDVLVSLDDLALALSLSKRWLRREADANRLPSLRAGRRRLFNVEAVRQALAVRAAKGANP
ncbi:MAG: DNA-binding protein [Planctomycetes bacterium]|jgi:excisionase family DNA binding protein|nr:DNA-binding protein [Planctomycetota bacterium]